MAFIDGLPVESATLTRMRDRLTPEDRERLTSQPQTGHGPWSQTDMLLALVADRVAQQTWMLAEWAKGKRPPPPKPIPRPGVDVPAAQGGRATTVDQLRARVSARTWEIAEAIRRGEQPPPPQRAIGG